MWGQAPVIAPSESPETNVPTFSPTKIPISSSPTIHPTADCPFFTVKVDNIFEGFYYRTPRQSLDGKWIYYSGNDP